ncbi:MAG TPA: hypothetical protein DDW30_07290 [Clostridiales bacterium]|nr:hypothetical protein [Clostridiales bacterium]
MERWSPPAGGEISQTAFLFAKLFLCASSKQRKSVKGICSIYILYSPKRMPTASFFLFFANEFLKIKTCKSVTRAPLFAYPEKCNPKKLENRFEKRKTVKYCLKKHKKGEFLHL